VKVNAVVSRSNRAIWIGSTANFMEAFRDRSRA